MLDEKDLKFDRKKHVCYSGKAKKAVLEYLRGRFTAEETDEIFEKIQYRYEDFLSDLPYLGGKKSSHNGAGGTYDCILLFACYDVLDRDMTLDDIYNLNNSLFLPSFKSMGKVFNLNKPWVMKLAQFAFSRAAREDEKMLTLGAEGYIMKTEPYDKAEGIRYSFERCPIAEFAKKHGFTEIMPAICNGDYPAMELLHGGLIREHTCANGDVCDYRIVGDEDGRLRLCPKKTDEAGYFYNEI